MSDIRFNLESFGSILRGCEQAQKDVEERTRRFFSIRNKIEKEVALFCNYGTKAEGELQKQLSETERLISTMNSKKESAISKKIQEIKRPTMPSISSTATTEQRDAIMSSYHDKVSQVDAQNAAIRKQNQRIDEYISRCVAAKNNLEAITIHLRQQIFTLKNNTKHIAFEAKESLERTIDVMNQSPKINHAMNTFYSALKQTYQSADELNKMEAKSIKNVLYIDKLFVIKNDHHFSSTSNNFDFQNSYSQSIKKEKCDDLREEEFIKDRDDVSFFENIATASHIKMPSANLHKLGGKNFILKMNALGYTMVVQSNGTSIDENGIIHWKRGN